MKNSKLVRFVESLILLPITTISTVPIGVGPLTQATLSIVASPQTVLVEQLNTQAEDFRKKRAEAIDNYFLTRGMPLYGMGMKMVLEAERNDLDWRLIPAIAVRESTGGKFACRKADHNPFGWGSCRIHFNSNDHAVETVALNLGGNNPKTARYYAGKDVRGILRAYNPPSIVPNYADQVMRIMSVIGEEKLGERIPNTELALNI